jgi:hypothetical protein
MQSYCPNHSPFILFISVINALLHTKIKVV